MPFGDKQSRRFPDSNDVAAEAHGATGCAAATTVDDVSTEVGQTVLGMFQRGDASPTVGEVLDSISNAIGGARFTGSFDTVAQQLAAYVEFTDIDGFLIENPLGGAEGYGPLMTR